ncbi:MAG TPA: hypothetical protein VGP56_11080, partial [Gaiellaceae bacterium]|nr:hypothetical protein [Gaiellaceae bacterium]
MPMEVRMRCAREALEVDVGTGALTFQFGRPGVNLGRRKLKHLPVAPDLREAVGRSVESAAPAKGQGVQFEIVHSRSVRRKRRPDIVSLPLPRCGLPAGAIHERGQLKTHHMWV